MERLKVCAKHPIWYFKTHGEPMQVRGVPDVLGIYFGLWFSIEFKVMRNGKLNFTPYQVYTGDILTKANAINAATNNANFFIDPPYRIIYARGVIIP